MVATLLSHALVSKPMILAAKRLRVPQLQKFRTAGGTRPQSPPYYTDKEDFEGHDQMVVSVVDWVRRSAFLLMC